MGNFRNAPQLIFSEDKDARCGLENFFLLPKPLASAVMYGIKGNCLNQLKLMFLLLGTKEGFFVSEEFVLKTLGITQQAYLKARKALIDKGWLAMSKKPHQIIVCMDKIWEDYYESLREYSEQSD